MRLGILGGTFDPVHYGHLLLAECAREQCRLDQVWFMPAAVPPHKQDHDITPATQRIEMLELALSGNPAFLVSRYETDRGGLNFTADTLDALAAAQPESELFFLLGADSLAELGSWRDPQRICQRAMLAVVARVGQPLDYAPVEPLVAPERLIAMRQHQIEMPLVDLSSRDLRRRVAQGLSIRYRTPRAVEKFIEASRLYRT